MIAMPALYTLKGNGIGSWLHSPTTLKATTGIETKGELTTPPFVCGTEEGRITTVGTATVADAVIVIICVGAAKKTVWVGSGESPSFSLGDLIDCVIVTNVVLVGDFLCDAMVAEVWMVLE
jgi:hypothetical protein